MTLSRPLAQPVPLGVLARLAGLGEPAAEEAARPEAGTTKAGTSQAAVAEAPGGASGARPDDKDKM